MLLPFHESVLQLGYAANELNPPLVFHEFDQPLVSCGCDPQLVFHELNPPLVFTQDKSVYGRFVRRNRKVSLFLV